jgi:CheY-like chemotaxis protein
LGASVARHDVVTVTIRVRDTGIGIRANLQQRLFHRFSQIEPSRTQGIRGTGLGLAISDRLSRLLDGSLAVESCYGEGSTFTFVFRGQAAAPGTGWRAPDLHGLRVVTLLGAGIVGEQILSLLRSWLVQARPHDAGLVDPAANAVVDAVVVDVDASGGALYATLLRNRTEWGLDRVPFIAISQAGSTVADPIADGDAVIRGPVRVQALHDALSAATGRSRPLSQRTSPGPPIFAGELAVLVVEDNEPNRRIIRLMLNELGLDPDEAATGHAAVAAAARRHYDIILMDLQLSDLDGLEATRCIRAQEHGSRAAIVALTAGVFESDEARCRAAGMDAYLQKPLKLDTLSDALCALARPPR